MTLHSGSPRLPVTHPDYRYPASKNPYWKKIQEYQGIIFSDHETEEYRGQWRLQFKGLPDSRLSSSEIQARRQLWVEIGCNAGHVAVELAKQNPETALIGIDWKFKPIFRAAEKVQKRNLGNIVFFRAHAERAGFMFGADEIDRLHLFFPDPWPKKAHRKNRFLSVERLKDLHRILDAQGVFHIKTDHPEYFDSMLESIEASSDQWRILEMTRDLHQGHPAPETLDFPEVTLFEKLFIKDGIPIQSLKLQPIKRGDIGGQQP